MEGKENALARRKEAKAEGALTKPPKKPGGFSFAKLGQKRRENLVAQGLVPADVPVETFIRRAAPSKKSRAAAAVAGARRFTTGARGPRGGRGSERAERRRAERGRAAAACGGRNH